MRVMVITHDTERRTRLTEFLGHGGYEVFVPLHRQDMWRMVKQTPPHVIVLDLYVADPNGADILGELRADGYNGKVVALAGGWSTRATLSKCWQEGIDQVVGGVEVTGGVFDPSQVDVAIQASFQKNIAQRAFHLWEQLGRPEGQEQQHWAQAKEEFFTQLNHPAQGLNVRKKTRTPHHDSDR